MEEQLERLATGKKPAMDGNETEKATFGATSGISPAHDTVTQLATTAKPTQSTPKSIIENYRLLKYQPFQEGEEITLTSGKYTVNKTLGIGEGITVLATNSSGKKKTIKFLDLFKTNGNPLEQIERRERLEDRLRKAATILGRDIMTGREENYSHGFTIITDYIEGQNLEEKIRSTGRNFTQEETRKMLAQDLTELAKLHGAGMLHNDNAPTNTIVDAEGNYHLTDYGLSLKDRTDGNHTTTVSIRATLSYIKRITFDPLPIDDLYAEARKAVYAMSGKHPDYESDEKKRKELDVKMVNALPSDKDFKKILLKMMGYEQKSPLLTRISAKLRGKKLYSTYNDAREALDDIVNSATPIQEENPDSSAEDVPAAKAEETTRDDKKTPDWIMYPSVFLGAIGAITASLFCGNTVIEGTHPHFQPAMIALATYLSALGGGLGGRFTGNALYHVFTSRKNRSADENYKHASQPVYSASRPSAKEFDRSQEKRLEKILLDAMLTSKMNDSNDNKKEYSLFQNNESHIYDEYLTLEKRRRFRPGGTYMKLEK